MNWLLSILIGILTGVAGIACGLFLGTVNVRWYRISSFEGGSGYYVIAIGLAGGIVGLIAGIVATRIAASGGDISFLRGLGTALASLLGVSLFVMGLCWLGADIPPTIDGRGLTLEVEVRAPKRFTKDFPRESYGCHSYLENSAGKMMATEEIKMSTARFEEGRWVIPTTLSLNTQSSAKRFRAYLNKEFDALATLRLRGNPRKSDLAWSQWYECAWVASQPRPTADEAFFVRYRVVMDEPAPAPEPKPQATGEAATDEAMAELEDFSGSSPLQDLFPYTELNRPEVVRRAAIRRLQERQHFGTELGCLVDSTDIATASAALRTLAQLEEFPAELHFPVGAAGRRLLEWKAALKAGVVPPGCDTLDEYDYGACSRNWLAAVNQLRAKAGGDFTAEFAALTKDANEQELAAMREWGGFPAVSAK